MREVHNDKCPPQETRKVSNKQPKFILQELGKEQSPKLKEKK